MAVKFGPGGNSLSFGKRKFPDELPSYLASMGLTAMRSRAAGESELRRRPMKSCLRLQAKTI